MCWTLLVRYSAIEMTAIIIIIIICSLPLLSHWTADSQVSLVLVTWCYLYNVHVFSLRWLIELLNVRCHSSYLVLPVQCIWFSLLLSHWTADIQESCSSYLVLPVQCSVLCVAGHWAHLPQTHHAGGWVDQPHRAVSLLQSSQRYCHC